MEIYLDKRAVRQIRLSAGDAIEEGDTETLREDVIQTFSDDDIEEIERRIDTGDFYDFISDVIDEWSGDDTDELFELLESQLSDAGIDLKYGTPATNDDEEEQSGDEEEVEEELEISREDEEEL